MECPVLQAPPAIAWQFHQVWQAFGYPYTSDDSLPPPPKGAGKWIAAVGKGELSPTHYETSELGFRTSLVPKTTIDYSMFYSRYTGEYTVLPFNLDTVVVSRLNNQDTIVPAYIGNLADGHSYGLEAIVRWEPVKSVRLETSYSMLIYQLDSRYGFGNPGGPSALYTPDNPASPLNMPEHMLRERCYLDFPYDVHLMVYAEYHTAFHNSYYYNYQQLRWDILNTSGVTTGPGPGVRLDFNIEKCFWNDRFSVSFWGRNVLVQNQIESYLWALHAYPQTVSREFGINAGYRF
jgi:hypothetical protein